MKEYVSYAAKSINSHPDILVGSYTLEVSMFFAAVEVVGYGGRAQPNWFKESSNILAPLIDAKNACRRCLLENDTLSTRQEFCKY